MEQFNTDTLLFTDKNCLIFGLRLNVLKYFDNVLEISKSKIRRCFHSPDCRLTNSDELYRTLNI